MDRELWKEVNDILYEWLVDNGLDRKVSGAELDYLTDRIAEAVETHIRRER
jgi:hypothetical protein